MKHKKTLAALLCAALLALTALMFVACGQTDKGEAEVKESGEKLLVIEATKSGGSLEDALKALKKAGKLTYQDVQTEFGLSMTSINGYTVDASKNEYWAQYSSLGVLDGVTYSSTEYGSYSYNGMELGYSSYGPSGMPLVEGAVYVFVVESW